MFFLSIERNKIGVTQRVDREVDKARPLAPIYFTKIIFKTILIAVDNAPISRGSFIFFLEYKDLKSNSRSATKNIEMIYMVKMELVCTISSLPNLPCPKIISA